MKLLISLVICAGFLAYCSKADADAWAKCRERFSKETCTNELKMTGE